MAVVLVVVYHLWPAVLPGGYVGVDVFFAISGFLITSLLLREARRSGRVSIPGFWARRARRILPAALVTLLASAIAAIVLVPSLYRETFLADIRASTLYAENWHLAATSTDYMHASDAPSMVRHFWSLAAEEQFYLVWPLLIAGALWTTARRGAAVVRRRRIGIVLGAVVALSLGYSIWLTRVDPVRAFYVTPARAWEFGAGGLLALLNLTFDTHERLRAGLSWAAIAAIFVAGVAYSAATPFPGYAALLPVVGTLVVIVCGMPAASWSPSRLYRLPSLQFVGDTSYSIYLWHWPLIILAPFVTHRALDTPIRSLIVVLTLLLARLSKLAVEDPIRKGRLLTNRRARWTFGAAAAGMAVVLAVTAVGVAGVHRELRSAERATQRVLAQPRSCFGAAAHDPAHPCADPKLRHTVVPTPLQAAHEGHPRCRVVQRSAPEVCAFGTAIAKARQTVALLGDSHALALRSAMEKVSTARRWHGVSIYQSMCPFTRATPTAPPPYRSRCTRWYQDVQNWFAKHPEVSIVVVSGHRGERIMVPAGQSPITAKMNGFAAAWNALPPSVKHVVVVRDVPYIAEHTQECVSRAIAGHRPAGPACAVPRRVALSADPAILAAQRGLSPRAQVVDLTRFMCDRRVCEPVIGGVLVHKDTGHLTALFSATLGPYLLAAVDDLSLAWPDVGGRAS